MKGLVSVLLGTVAIFVTAHILPGVEVGSFGVALIVSVVLGLINTFIRPILFILTIPINLLTLGLFSFVVMGFSVWLASAIVPSFEVASFFWCILFSLVFTVINRSLRLIY